uniref:HTH-type transcriptional regulator SgrR n=1 Tax=Candidatus Methanophaga sp. ANME-1 ERB7 TaxID=2759913 RepID=A0A7G9ZAS1_9EURY|nr:HTH-type transcriptional regulator SgrR [Methanosarcinales archaeon ANME-1 ERB7]
MKQTIKVLGIITVIAGVMLLASMPTASAKLYGDANVDDVIDEADITYVWQIIAGVEEENELADANQDGVINARDATYIAGIINGDNPFPGGTLTAAMIFFKETVDPAVGWTGWYVRKAGIYETLFANDENMVLTPELATDYEQVSDTEWEISLREGVTFHDGTPFNADAVVYSINRVLDESNSRHTEYDFIESIDKKDDYTVTITTEGAYAPTIASLTDPLTSIVSPNVEDLGTEAGGTGPFKLVEFEPAVSMSMERNDNYWGGPVKLESATFEYIKDPQTRAYKLEAAEVDMARGIPQAEVDIIDGKSDLDVISKETVRTYFMYVNTEKEPLNDVRVRQAINYAINRDEIVETALEGVGGVAAKSVFPSVMPWSANDDLVGYPHNQTEALALLADCGITDTDGDGVLDYDGSPFEITIKTYTSRAELKPTAEVIVEQLKEIGIKASVETRDSSTLKEEVAAGNYDLALWSWGVAPTGDPDYFLSYHFDSSGKYAGWAGYNNPEVDGWIEAARTTFDDKARWDYYKQVQAQILEDSPKIFVFYQNELVGLNTGVKGYVIYPNEITFLTKDIYNTA